MRSSSAKALAARLPGRFFLRLGHVGAECRIGHRRDADQGGLVRQRIRHQRQQAVVHGRADRRDLCRVCAPQRRTRPEGYRRAARAARRAGLLHRQSPRIGRACMAPAWPSWCSRIVGCRRTMLLLPPGQFRKTAAGVQRRPHRHQSADLSRHRSGRLRDHGEVLQGADAVRSAARQASGRSVEARRHGDRSGSGACAALSGGEPQRVRHGRRRSMRRLPRCTSTRWRAASPIRPCNCTAPTGSRKNFRSERMVRDVRGFSIGYGTTEIQRNTIAHEILEGRYVT